MEICATYSSVGDNVQSTPLYNILCNHKSGCNKLIITPCEYTSIHMRKDSDMQYVIYRSRMRGEAYTV